MPGPVHTSGIVVASREVLADGSPILEMSISTPAAFLHADPTPRGLLATDLALVEQMSLGQHGLVVLLTSDRARALLVQQGAHNFGMCSVKPGSMAEAARAARAQRVPLNAQCMC